MYSGEQNNGGGWCFTQVPAPHPPFSQHTHQDLALRTAAIGATPLGCQGIWGPLTP